MVYKIKEISDIAGISIRMLPAAVITNKKKKYDFLKVTDEQLLKSIKTHTDSLLKNSPSGGFQYKENETFYLFQKVQD
ncbi:hypothetical protein FZC66_16475 [Priestia megaterium]|nr:hypothetical protein FZC66_16475 [Priestia megaterium]